MHGSLPLLEVKTIHVIRPRGMTRLGKASGFGNFPAPDGKSARRMGKLEEIPYYYSNSFADENLSCGKRNSAISGNEEI